MLASAISTPVASVDTPESVSDRVIFGRFMLPDKSEHACQVTHLSIDGATFLSEHIPPEGETLVAYLEQIGRVEAITKKPTDKGFWVDFSVAGARREKLAARLKWLTEKQTNVVEEERKYSRRELTDTRSRITMLDGRSYPCEVNDISVTGAAISSGILPANGALLYLGKMRARVVRYVDNGFAIQFLSGTGGNPLPQILVE